MKRAIYWFNQDLRLDDNPSLCAAAAKAQQLLCVYVVDTAPRFYGPLHRRTGKHRLRFLQESLKDLQQQLAALGQSLLVLEGTPLTVMSKLIQQHRVDAVFAAEQMGLNERRDWQQLRDHFYQVNFITGPTQTLLQQQHLPFPLEELPASFTPFREAVEPLPATEVQAAPTSLPSCWLSARTVLSVDQCQRLTQNKPSRDLRGTYFNGGATAARRHLSAYFQSSHPARYKLTRNGLDNWNDSTKFSPWLALGCLSVRRLWQSIDEYEQQQGANESTYWIKFELLWREYFQWYALRHGAALFSPSGVKQRKVPCCFSPERFQRWCAGNTPYPIVNACMKQLAACGYLSNRGRQLVASCFVNELQLDWRFGAAWFEEQLVDYDVASNWGNWQYIAGVGADPRGQRHFNLENQTREYDPQGTFIRKWEGDQSCQQLDSVDAADWPIDPRTD